MASRRVNWSDEEVDTLLDGLRVHKEMLFGKLSAKCTIAEKNQIYADILLSINAVGGADRRKEELLKKWTDMKSRTKKKEQMRLKKLGETGSGGGPVRELSSLEEKVLSLIPRTLVKGVQGGTDTCPSTSKRKIGKESLDETEFPEIDDELDSQSMESNLSTEDIPSTSTIKENEPQQPKKRKRKENECSCSDDIIEIQRDLLKESRRRNIILEKIQHLLEIKLQQDAQKCYVVAANIEHSEQ